MERPVIEYLGDIDAELLLRNLTNINTYGYVNSIDEIRVALEELRNQGRVLTVTAEFKHERVAPRASLKNFVRLIVAPGKVPK